MFKNNYVLIFNEYMKDKNILELLDLYNSGKLITSEKKVIELIEKDPKNFIPIPYIADLCCN